MAYFSYRSIAILIFSISQIYGSCVLDQLHSSSSNDNSMNQIVDGYCEYAGSNYTIGSNWTIPYPDCLSCQCSQYGLECCGFGSAAGIIEAPENCELVAGTCEVRFVLKDNPYQSCDENDVIKPIRLKTKRFHTRRKNSTFILFKRKLAYYFN